MPERSPGSVLLAYDKEGLWSSRRQIESEELFWYRCEELCWNAIETDLYGMPEQFRKGTLPVVILYSHKVDHNLMDGLKNWTFRWSLVRQKKTTTKNQERCVSRLTNSQKRKHSVKNRYGNKWNSCQEGVAWPMLFLISGALDTSAKQIDASTTG